ncbi:MAG: non-canonical purine NTP pyrophosphatase [Patescibacteria group bacterium]|jgi:inosine/xanthosine triphosphate pyrophosphatase family protein
MNRIIIGTKNTAKINQIRGALALDGIFVEGLPPNIEFDEIKEDGATAQENARKKALIYSRTLGEPVLSIDNALYFEKLEPEQQPGINVRRINQRDDRPTDEELTKYYQNLIGTLGDRINGRWEFAVCVAYPDGSIKEATIISPRIFVNKKSEKTVSGYPLKSLQIEPESGKYISEMTQEEQNIFWQKAIGTPLCEFVKNLAEWQEQERLNRT